MTLLWTKWAISLLSLCCLPLCWGRRLCSSFRGHTCIVTQNRTISRSFILRQSSDIEFRGARWQCVVRSASYESLRIDVAVPGTVRLMGNSLLHCATVMLQGRMVEISDTSEVSANGTSFTSEPFASMEGESATKLWSAPQRGASHGGVGGTQAGCTGDEAQLMRRMALVYGDPIAPWRFGRAAGPSSNRGLGGGRVRIIAAESLVLNGSISAAGRGPEDGDGDESAACGSGGSIWITSGVIVQPGSSQTTSIPSVGSGAVDFVSEFGTGDGTSLGLKGRILAVGGCCSRCMCGGGGRVLTEISGGPKPRSVIAAGGCFRDAVMMDGEGCRCGSAGTWTFRHVPHFKRRRNLPGTQRTSPARQKLWIPRWLRDQHLVHVQRASAPISVTEIHVDNSHAISIAGTKLPQPTPLSAFSMPVIIQLKDALVIPLEQEPFWTISGLKLLSDQTGSTMRHLGTGPLILNFSIPNEGLELAFSSILEARELRVQGARRITLLQDAAIDVSLAFLDALEDIEADQGTLGQGEGAFVMRAKRASLGSGRLLMASVIVEDELVLKRGSRLQSSQRRCDQLPASLTDPCALVLGQSSRALHRNQSLADNVTFDIVLASKSGNIAVEEGSKIQAAAVLLCSTQNLTLSGLISVKGRGCPPNRGEGPGMPPQATCGGGGGAHCGNGGDAVRNRSRATCVGTGGLKYDGWWASEMTGTTKPALLPTWSASGGGGGSAGAGGGIIWVRTQELQLLSNGTCFSASGGDALPWADGAREGSGGGAGGTVIINASLISGSGNIVARGGQGGGCIGGGGGGGAIGSGGPNASEAWALFDGTLEMEGGFSDTSESCGRNVGQRGDTGELLQLNACPPGRAGIFCAECPAGTYNPPLQPDNLTAQFRLCLPCQNKPAHADYISTGWLNESCPYACPAGFPPVEVNIKCDDPWTYYFAFFGGVWGVVLLILVTAFLFGLSLSAKHVQTRRRLQWIQKQKEVGRKYGGMDEEALLLFESLRGRHPLADLGQAGEAGRVPHLPGRTSTFTRLRSIPSSLWRRFCGRVNRHQNAHLLLAGDLPYHLTRIYLHGENSPRDPWRLCRQPPEELVHLIDDGRWDNFASEVTRRCTERMKFQLIAEGVLQWLYLPLAELLRWHLRFSRAADVALFVWSCSEDSRPDQIFWRLSLDSSNRFGLKFGTDRQMTLAYVDVLDYGKSLEDWVVKPQLPMVISAAGDGEYTAPYQLDYSDPFVQSVAQYLGRRPWHQVLLAFNLMARLLPPNPTEDDLKQLRRSMHRVSSRVLLQTDLECQAVLFEVAAPKPNYKTKRRKRSLSTYGSRGISRSNSWDEILRAHNEGAGRLNTYASDMSPTGAMTPIMQAPETTQRRRVTLVLTQRTTQVSALHAASSIQRRSGNTAGAVAENALRERLRRIVPLASGYLVSPAACLNFVTCQSPPATFTAPPETDISDLPLLDGRVTSLESGIYEDFEGMFRQRTAGRSAGLMGFDDTEPNSPLGIAVPWPSEPSSPMPAQPEQQVPRSPRQAWPRRRPHELMGMCSVIFCGWCDSCARRLEAVLYRAMAPGKYLYSVYLRRLRGVRAFAGVGRQTGLYLRHRKPRGSQASTLLCLMLALAIAVLGFIAQSAVLFRLNPRHGAFFAALLCPPFADILGLVYVTLYVCSAAQGTTACLFIVASNWNTAIGLASRVSAMDRWQSTGLLHVLGEYFVMFSVKISLCRLVNLMIAYGEAEPAMLEPSGNDADHEWVREHVLFGPAVKTPQPSAVGTMTADLVTASTRHLSFQEELYAEQNSHSWLMSGLPNQAQHSHRPLSALMADPGGLGAMEPSPVSRISASSSSAEGLRSRQTTGASQDTSSQESMPLERMPGAPGRDFTFGDRFAWQKKSTSTGGRSES